MTTAHGRQLEELVRLSLLREYGPVQLAGRRTRPMAQATIVQPPPGPELRPRQGTSERPRRLGQHLQNQREAGQEPEAEAS